MNPTPPLRTHVLARPSAVFAAFLFLACALAVSACVEPPPKIPSVPATGFALRLRVFGASAIGAQHTFAAVKDNNPTFSLVEEGGDGELLVGLENDSPHCVAPTAMCSYRVSYRIKDPSGAVVSARTTTIEATSNRCDDLCDKALTRVAVKLVETAVSELRGDPSSTEPEAPAPEPLGPARTGGAMASSASALGLAGGARRGKAELQRASEPSICAAGHGPRLPSQEAEARAAQIEVLKRMGTLDEDEYDCLRKAYLERL
jgi:hypothetical protein